MLESDAGLDMSRLALNLSGYVNGVAARHREVATSMFPGYAIHRITNGVHSQTWATPAFRALFDAYLPGWDDDPALLRNAIGLPAEAVWQAHVAAKASLLEAIHARTGRALAPDVCTIGVARRATAYKRTSLVLKDPERLRAIVRRQRLQFVFAGKAHPQDAPGKALIREVHAAAHALREDVPVVYLADYDLALAHLLVGGCDLWLNTPARRQEASGTSGMKAAHNGVPSLSVLDGWWLEGHVEGVTGWAVGPLEVAPGDDPDEVDARDLYDKLAEVILPLYHDARDRWITVMQHAIALNASYFNTHRMVQQYVLHAYGSGRSPP